VTARPLDPGALAVVDGYLDELAPALGRRDRASRDLLAEVRDGLLTAVERDVAVGRPAVDAARAAVGLCGTAKQLAPLLLADVVAARARGTGRSLVRTGGFAAVAWVATAGTSAALPWRAAAPWLGLGVLLTLACSLLANTALSPRVARLAAIAAAVACAGTDLAGLSFLAASAVIAPGAIAWPAAMAVAVSGARLVFAGTRVHRLRPPLPG